MRCEQFEERLHGLLDRRAIPSQDRALLAHASVCRHCEKMLRWEEEVAEYLGDDGDSASVDFSDLVTARLTRGVAAHRVGLLSRFKLSPGVSPWLGLAGAAVLLIGVGVAWQLAPRHVEIPQGVTPRAAVVANKPAPRLTVGTESDGSLPPGATRELVSLARGRLEGADKVAATVADDLSPWARSIGGALATLTGRGLPARSATQGSDSRNTP